MAANTALINASFKLGASKAAVDVPDMKPVYEAQAAIPRSILSATKTILDDNKKDLEQQNILKERQLQPLKKNNKKWMEKVIFTRRNNATKSCSSLKR